MMPFSESVHTELHISSVISQIGQIIVNCQKIWQKVRRILEGCCKDFGRNLEGDGKDLDGLGKDFGRISERF